MYIPKKYGESQVVICPFCNKNVTTKNSQKVPVCPDHKRSFLKDLTCFCGDYIDLRDGKWGIYFNCMNCGNLNLKKVLEMNPKLKENIEKIEKKPEKRVRPPLFPPIQKKPTITTEKEDNRYI